jgi:hypothetical protein
MAMVESRTSDLVPAWPATSLRQRLQECRIMLYQHGILTDAEAGRADQRILCKAMGLPTERKGRREEDYDHE